MNPIGKTALITGAGRGIGKGCAIELARGGATAVVNDRSNSPDLAATVAQIRNAGGEAQAVEANVFTREGCEQLLRRTLELADHIDILVSNPAYSVRSPFLEFDPVTFERVVQGTLVAGFHLSQLVARHMVKRGSGGKIVFISSVHAEAPYQNAAAYNAAKAGLNHLAKTIARELAPHKINVNIIEPGWIDTPGERESFGADFLEAQGRDLPWGRLGMPADIGKAVAFLCSDEADYITGTILRVDGGYLHKDT
jgi:glucose 1-dehydrogenase